MTAPFMQAGGALRQSLLRTFDQCPQQAVWTTESPAGWSTPAQALGTAFHSVAEAILATMQEHGRSVNEHGEVEEVQQLSTQEAVEIAYEVLARPGTPHLSGEQVESLVGMVIGFCDVKWQPSHIIGMEERLFADVTGPDGVARTVTGQPDVLMADPPGGAICVDFKSGRGKPKQPRNPDDPEAWKKDHGRAYLSERGHFQLDVYGMLILRTFPNLDRVTLRELHVRWGETREAVLTRDEMEHVERRVGLQLMRLEQTLTGVIDVEPRPGVWCHHCPRRSECPVPWEERLEGAVDGNIVEMAERYTIACEVRDHHTPAIKAWLDEQDVKAVEIGGGIVGWDREGSGRKFGTHKVDS